MGEGLSQDYARAAAMLPATMLLPLEISPWHETSSSANHWMSCPERATYLTPKSVASTEIMNQSFKRYFEGFSSS